MTIRFNLFDRCGTARTALTFVVNVLNFVAHWRDAHRQVDDHDTLCRESVCRLVQRNDRKHIFASRQTSRPRVRVRTRRHRRTGRLRRTVCKRAVVISMSLRFSDGLFYFLFVCAHFKCGNDRAARSARFLLRDSCVFSSTVRRRCDARTGRIFYFSKSIRHWNSWLCSRVLRQQPAIV